MINDDLPEPIDASRTCVFTIVSRNYLHYALNLMVSVSEHMPGTRRAIVLCDASDDLPALPDGIKMLTIDQLGIPNLDRLVYQYTILELNTAIKPFAFSQILAAGDCDSVVYFDPDIQLFSSGTPLLQRLHRADVVLTPHLTAPLDDERHPSDLSILQSGTYNLGFLAVRRCTDVMTMLSWWQRKLMRDCVVDIPRGLFTDQKWMDLIPGFVQATHVERHPGWNVAYWNLLHRPVSREHGRYLVSGQPLFFFHFSGYDPRSGAISKHQDRFTLDKCGDAVQALFAQYLERLEGHGRARFAAMPYSFARLADGTPLPDAARQVLRQQLDWSQPIPDLRSAAGAAHVISFLTEPADDRQPALSRLALQLHRARIDLQSAFPDVMGAHRVAYLGWFAERAGPEAGIAGVLAQDSGSAAGASQRSATANPPVQAAAPSAAVARRASALPFRVAYRLAWSARHVLRPLSSVAFRNRVRSYLVRQAFPPQPATSAEQEAAIGSSARFGVRVIGYVKAESGVGESARSTLRALRSSGIAHSLTDFRAGNVSRMGEWVDESLASTERLAVSLFHINADQLPLARTVLGEAHFTVPYRIGFWAWELERFPTEWHGAFDHVDEVWVPSSFCQGALAAVSPVPVLCMPHSVEVPARLLPDRQRFGLKERSVVFLAMADMMSSAERKNPFGAVEAFAAAAQAGMVGAELVVKVSNAARDPAAQERLNALAASCPGIHLISDYLDRPALNCLLDTVDCFVSLHRAEGFGLVMAEAMARGKVVIATGWSGNMDFMTAHNSLPVDYRLKALEADHGPYKRGERWAEPVLADAAAKIRRVCDEPALRSALGQRARDDCRQHLAPEVIGQRLAARLETLRVRKQLM